MMKVCIFTETFHPVVGGGETQARLLAEGLIARGFEVTVLTRRSSPELAREERVGAILVRRIGQPGPGQGRKWGLVTTGLRALLDRRHPWDLLFVSGFRMLGIPAGLVGRRLGRPVILKADCEGEMSGAYFAPGLARHGVRLAAWPVRAFLALRNRALRDAAAYVAISASIAAELETAGIPRDRVHTIANAVDTARFRPADRPEREALRRQLGLPEEAPVVVYTGRLVRYKGLPLLVQTWPAIVRRHPQALLLLIGTGGLDIHACEPELRAAAQSLGIERSVRFTGSVGNVPDYLRAADAFAFPTENDAFPSSVVEAMAAGLPVVATPVGAIAEMIEDGESGLLVEPRDSAGLERALLRVLEDAMLARRLGERAWQVVQERYAGERIAGQYADLFRRIGVQGRAVEARPA
jgi:glycosyltransferase involved in cell wall biosynthesis